MLLYFLSLLMFLLSLLLFRFCLWVAISEMKRLHSMFVVQHEIKTQLMMYVKYNENSARVKWNSQNNMDRYRIPTIQKEKTREEKKLWWIYLCIWKCYWARQHLLYSLLRCVVCECVKLVAYRCTTVKSKQISKEYQLLHI